MLKDEIEGKERSFYKNSFFLSMSLLINSPLRLIFLFLAIRLYTDHQIGTTSSLFSIIGWIAIFSSLGTDSGLKRFLGFETNDKIELINTALTIVFFSSFFFTFVIVLIISLDSSGNFVFVSNILVILILILLGVSVSESQIIDNIYTGIRKGEVVFAKTTITYLILLTSIILLSDLEETGILLSYLFGFLGASIFGMVLLPKFISHFILRISINKIILGRILKFILKSYFAVLIINIPKSVFPIILVLLLSAESSAYFYIAWIIANMLYMISLSFSSAAFVENPNSINSFLKRSKRGTIITYSIISVLFVLFMLFGDNFLALFGSAYSMYSYKPLLVLIITTFPITINYIYANYCNIKQTLNIIIIRNTILMFLSIGVSIIAVPRFGIIGVAIGWLIGQTLILIFPVLTIINSYSKKRKVES